MEGGFDVDFAGLALPFPEVENITKGGGIGAGELGHGGQCGAAGFGHGHAEGDERVAEESAESGDRGGHNLQVSAMAERGGEDGLAKADGGGAEFAFDLEAMELERNFEWSEEILAEEDAMVHFDVEKLDGENVGGMDDFVESEDQRGRISLLHPPFGGRMKLLELGATGLVDEAKSVEVGMAGGELAGDGGAVEDDGFEIVEGRRFQAIDKFDELGFHAEGSEIKKREQDSQIGEKCEGIPKRRTRFSSHKLTQGERAVRLAEKAPRAVGADAPMSPSPDRLG